MKRLIQRVCRRFGVEVGSARFHRSVMDFVFDRNIDLVLDVGANVGQFGESLRQGGYRGKIVSFEPVPSVFDALAAKAARSGNWEANNFALGASAGHSMINIPESSVFSSLLPATKAVTQFGDTAVASRREEIDVRRLDDSGFEPSANMLLKIDTQGFERQVLEGGRRTLSAVKGVLMELPIVHLYQGTWEFHEAIAFMAQAGFVPAQIHPANYHTGDEMSLIEVDCLFRPRDQRLDGFAAFTQPGADAALERAL